MEAEECQCRSREGPDPPQPTSVGPGLAKALGFFCMSSTWNTLSPSMASWVQRLLIQTRLRRPVLELLLYEH